MIQDKLIPELEGYRSFEGAIPLVQDRRFSSSVVFGQNEQIPIHGWFRFKEGYSASLVSDLLRDYSSELPRNLKILDPYCGVGTTLLSSQCIGTHHVSATGIERNPFIAFIAETKLSWERLNEETLLVDGDAALEAAAQYSAALPELSSIKKGRCISTYVARRLLAVQSAIPANCANRDFLRLGIAAAIEPLSKVRRDGRALRLVVKPRRFIGDTLRNIWKRMAEDVASMRLIEPRGSSSARVLQGDGRNPALSGVGLDSIDLIITSPPYPNNIDYSEVYKLELWLLGFITSGSDFLKLRHSTFRSHPTFNKASPLAEEYEQQLKKGNLHILLGSLLERLEDGEQGWRARLLKAYFSDMWTALENYKRVLRKGGRAFLVVGNSLHGTESPALVATDLILAHIAECVGLKVEKVAVARNFARRLSGNHFLRESIVILRK